MDKLIEEAETLNIYQLRAKVRVTRKTFCEKAICTMKRAELLANYKIFLEMNDKFEAAYEKGFEYTKPKPRIIPVAEKEIGDEDKVELKIPGVPAARVYMKSKD